MTNYINSAFALWNQEEEPALYISSNGICLEVFYDLTGNPFANSELTIPANAVYSDTIADAVTAFYKDLYVKVEVLGVERIDNKVMCKIKFPDSRVVNISIENIFSQQGLKDYLLPL